MLSLFEPLGEARLKLLHLSDLCLILQLLRHLRVNFLAIARLNLIKVGALSVSSLLEAPFPLSLGLSYSLLVDNPSLMLLILDSFRIELPLSQAQLAPLCRFYLSHYMILNLSLHALCLLLHYLRLASS